GGRRLGRDGGDRIPVLVGRQRSPYPRRVCSRLLGDRGRVGLGNEELGAAVVQDEGELRGLGLRVDEREGAAGKQRAEDRARRQRRVVEVERDPVAALEPRVLQETREPCRV